MGRAGSAYCRTMNILKRFLHRRVKTLNSLDAYALWSKTYPAEAHNQLMRSEQDAMLALMPALRDKIVLDLASGTGRYGKIASQEGAKQIIGLDNSAAMLRQNRMTALSLASTEALPLADQSMDVVLCGLALGHLSELQTSMKEISRVMKPNGIALISDVHPYQFLNGAQRTFISEQGSHYAVEHYVHHISDYFAVGQQCQLFITGLLEPCIVDNIPAVLVIRFQKHNQTA